MKQLVTVKADGSLHTLRNSRGFDLRKQGRISMTRTTDIKFCESRQKHFILFLGGNLKNKKADRYLAKKYLTRHDSLPNHIIGVDDVVLFDEYEEAVEYEVTIVGNIRKKEGVDFL